jgi:hypothetical protein
VGVADAEGDQFRFDDTDSVAGGGGENGAVVAQDAGGKAPVGCRFVEGGDHVDGLEDRESDRGDTQAGVVVDDVQDLDLAPVGQSYVGDVHLPAFIGQFGSEVDVGGLRTLVRLRGDKASSLEHPPDGRRGGDLGPPVRPAQVDPYRLGSGVEARPDELLSDADDLVLVAVDHLGG